jgi:hypothetical protein
MFHVKDVVDKMINYYQSANFKVKVIKSDGEGAINGLSSYFNSRGIVVNPTGKSQHVPQVERKIRVVKERVRSHINVLPFKLTKLLLVQLVSYCVQMINVVPQSTTYANMSPKEMFSGRKLDFSRDVRVSFGDYCQIHEDNEVGKNSMAERTADAIALKMKGNLQGTAEFLSLSSWRIVSRDNVDGVVQEYDVPVFEDFQNDVVNFDTDEVVMPENNILIDNFVPIDNSVEGEVHQEVVQNQPVQANSSRYNLRSNRAQPGRWAKNNNFNYVGVHYVTKKTQESVQEFGYKGVLAVVKELKQMINKEVWTPVHLNDMPEKRNKKNHLSRVKC